MSTVLDLLISLPEPEAPAIPPKAVRKASNLLMLKSRFHGPASFTEEENELASHLIGFYPRSIMPCYEACLIFYSTRHNTFITFTRDRDTDELIPNTVRGNRNGLKWCKERHGDDFVFV